MRKIKSVLANFDSLACSMLIDTDLVGEKWPFLTNINEYKTPWDKYATRNMKRYIYRDIYIKITSMCYW